MSPLLQSTASGLYCERGGFYIDPWGEVERAIITHAHSDHAWPGARHYLCARGGETLLRARLGPEASVDVTEYGAALDCNGVRVSLHPAGHVLGSAQVRVEYGGEVWVVSGDYKLEPDPTCTPFEPVRCHTFVTESTFGLPIYRWQPQSGIFAEINAWWRGNRDAGKASVLFVYSLGKAQRVLAGIDTGIGPVYTHGAVEKLTRCYREQGVTLPPATYAGDAGKTEARGALMLAPPSAMGTPWLRRFGAISTAFASGWMRIRGTRRRRSLDRGFALSDHADWPGLLKAIDASGASRVWVTHGYRSALVRWLQESRGLDAQTIDTRFEGERDETGAGEVEV